MFCSLCLTLSWFTITQELCLFTDYCFPDGRVRSTAWWQGLLSEIFESWFYKSRDKSVEIGKLSVGIRARTKTEKENCHWPKLDDWPCCVWQLSVWECIDKWKAECCWGEYRMYFNPWKLNTELGTRTVYTGTTKQWRLSLKQLVPFIIDSWTLVLAGKLFMFICILCCKHAG